MVDLGCLGDDFKRTHDFAPAPFAGRRKSTFGEGRGVQHPMSWVSVFLASAARSSQNGSRGDLLPTLSKQEGRECRGHRDHGVPEEDYMPPRPLTGLCGRGPSRTGCTRSWRSQGLSVAGVLCRPWSHHQGLASCEPDGSTSHRALRATTSTAWAPPGA